MLSLTELALGIWQDSVLWILIVGFMVGAMLAFALGANDCANSFGTAVGSGTMSLRMAFTLASLCETLGAVFLSANVIKTITTGVIDIDLYKTTPESEKFPCEAWNGTSNLTWGKGEEHLLKEKELMLGEVATIVGSGIWQLVATYFAWPASGTHSVVGGLLGFSIAANGLQGIKWMKIAKIVGAWFISPVMAGLLTIALYKPVSKYIVHAENPLIHGVWILPLLWGMTVFIDVGSILTTGDIFYETFGLSFNQFWLVALGVGALVAVGIVAFVVPVLRKFDAKEFEANNQNNSSNNNTSNNKAQILTKPELDIESDETGPLNSKSETNPEDDDSPLIRKMFESLQYLSAITGSLAHGGNAAGNTIGPVVLIFLIYRNPLCYDHETAPSWILLYGGLGITAGLWTLGSRVMKTIGEDLTKVTPSRGFCIEIMAAITELLAIELGLPISTTHCKVGAVVSLGLLQGGTKSVDLKLFQTIALSWILTIPAAGTVSAIVYLGLHYFCIHI